MKTAVREQKAVIQTVLKLLKKSKIIITGGG